MIERVSYTSRALVIGVLLALTVATGSLAQTPKPPTRVDILRGEYGRYRANNDLLFYGLSIRVDPEKKSVSGYNMIRFKMLKDDTRIQLDLYDNLNVDRITFNPANPSVPNGTTDRGLRNRGQYRPPNPPVLLKYEQIGRAHV